MNIDGYIVQVTIQYIAPAISLACMGMSVARYLRDQISTEGRKLVRRSMATFAVHPIAATFAMTLASSMHSIWGDTFVSAVLLVSIVFIGVALPANIYFGLRSRVPAGRRAGMAVFCISFAIVAGDLTLFFGLFSRVVA